MQIVISWRNQPTNQPTDNPGLTPSRWNKNKRMTNRWMMETNIGGKVKVINSRTQRNDDLFENCCRVEKINNFEPFNTVFNDTFQHPAIFNPFTHKYRLMFK